MGVLCALAKASLDWKPLSLLDFSWARNLSELERARASLSVDMHNAGGLGADLG